MNAEQINNIIKQQQEEIALLRKENEELKSQRPRYTCPQDEDLTGGDANYQYYYAVDDGEMTIWKVPHHLAEVKSAKTSYHGAVEQLFYDEGFGEEYGKLNYLIVREMKLRDLIKRPEWQPAAEKPKEEEEALAEQAFFEGKEGGVIRWKPKKKEDDLCGCAECEKCPSHINPYEWAEATHGEELNSDDDDYEDKIDGKWKCRRCGENKASSVVFKGGDCLNYCRECLDELEEDGQIEKGGDAANYHYKWGYADRMERGLE